MTTDDELLAAAWRARGNARLYGKTQVGAAAIDNFGKVHLGCNIEHRFRSHDIHAEVTCLSTLVASGGTRAVAIAIVAERERFTPCGACLDWVIEIGGLECRVVVQSVVGGPVREWTAAELAPFYPM